MLFFPLNSVPWDVFEVSWGALEATLERLGAAVGVS